VIGQRIAPGAGVDHPQMLQFQILPRNVHGLCGGGCIRTFELEYQAFKRVKCTIQGVIYKKLCSP
jgi:hypothetical protein